MVYNQPEAVLSSIGALSWSTCLMLIYLAIPCSCNGATVVRHVWHLMIQTGVAKAGALIY
eukprot:scaffold534740_cov19-Prasinocladus_malaysianus.AAC.1